MIDINKIYKNIELNCFPMIIEKTINIEAIKLIILFGFGNGILDIKVIDTIRIIARI